MEKIQVSDQLKDDYKKLIQAAQNIESAVGSAYIKLNKMIDVRKQVDVDLKTWWDKVAEEYGIDKSKDYFVDHDGAINVVEKPAPKAPEAAQAEEPKTEAPAEEEKPAETPEETPAEDPAPASAPEEDNKEGGTTADLT